MNDPRGDHPLKAPLRSATGGGLAAFHPYSRAGERGRPGAHQRAEVPMNKHIAKLREQLVRDMDRLTVELAEVANAINAIDGMSAAREGARDKRPSSVWTPERRHALSEKAKAKVAANPEHYQELARKMHAARRANGASGHAEASA